MADREWAVVRRDKLAEIVVTALCWCEMYDGDMKDRDNPTHSHDDLLAWAKRYLTEEEMEAAYADLAR